jgi:hypothetical protein
MLLSPKTLVGQTPPRAHILLLAAICDEHWLAGDKVQRFHNTSPEGRGVYHMICASVTWKKCGDAAVLPACIGASDVFLYNVRRALIMRFA